MKNYICTAKGFVVGLERINSVTHMTKVVYSEKLRDAQKFNTKAAQKFMENHDVQGFIWRPFAQEPVRDMYEVKKIHRYDFEYDDDDKKDAIQEWQPVKLMMTSDTDVGYLMSGKLKSEEAMTFEQAKAEALRRNLEMVSELNDKIKKLSDATERKR